MGYNKRHNKARLIFRLKFTHEGLKYSMAYVDASGRRILGYDNAEGKGHHRHFGDQETAFAFAGLEELTNRFLGEVKRLRGRHQ